MIRRFAIALLAAMLGFAVVACGKKGPLELPPGAEETKKKPTENT